MKRTAPRESTSRYRKIRRPFIHYCSVLACCLTLTPLALKVAVAAQAIEKPTGIYSSAISHGEALANEHARSALIRVKWHQLEPSPGEFNWALVQNQIDNMDDFSEGKFWSLAIIAGKESPHWLYNEADFLW